MFASSLVRAMSLRGLQVGVLKPVEVGCSLQTARDVSTSFGGMELPLDRESVAALERLEKLAGPVPSTHSVGVAPENLVPHDANMLIRACGRGLDLELVNLYRFAPSLEPAVATQLTSSIISVDRIKQRYEEMAGRSDLTVVEGCLGLMTPLGPQHLQCDLIRALGLSVVLVAPSRVGTIGACLMHAEVLAARNVPLAGVVLNRCHQRQVLPEEVANPSNIEAHCQAKVRGVLPHFEQPKLDDLDYLARRLEVHVDLDGLFRSESEQRTANS